MQKYIYHYTIFGQVSDPNAYGGNAYNSEVYGDSTQVGAEQPAGELANTGFDIMLPLALGATMVIGSVVALVKMHKGKKVQG